MCLNRPSFLSLALLLILFYASSSIFFAQQLIFVLMPRRGQLHELLFALCMVAARELVAIVLPFGSLIVGDFAKHLYECAMSRSCAFAHHVRVHVHD
ncbi:hypothetical protein BRADI_4g10443v3 [Brachypodium distachyon]|uniref:Uncharacterized protein n=1 Tax=Brachypodium distachyon TaxID=15368 RepID=A0A0Q3HG21_BRADI|nr:hypothetical protein BRADI_4g10443v3 [Brachypodium distachyon]